MAIRMRWWWMLAAGVLAAALLATLALGMPWTGFDFAVAAGLLVAGGLALEGAARLPGTWRWAAGAAAVGAVLLVWADGAVGVLR